MKSLEFEEAQLQPLTSDDDIQERVSTLIGRANIRQLWLLFLDGDGVQLPLLVPIEGLPSKPTPAEAEDIVTTIGEIMQTVSASSVVFVWERYGSAQLTAQDAAWARSLHVACLVGNVRLRAMLLSHHSGVSWIAQSDYGYDGSPG
jgi:hypothetical protein